MLSKENIDFIKSNIKKDIMTPCVDVDGCKVLICLEDDEGYLLGFKCGKDGSWINSFYTGLGEGIGRADITGLWQDSINVDDWIAEKNGRHKLSNNDYTSLYECLIDVRKGRLPVALIKRGQETFTPGEGWDD